MTATGAAVGVGGILAVELFETKARTLLDQADAFRALSSSLAHEDA